MTKNPKLESRVSLPPAPSNVIVHPAVVLNHTVFQLSRWGLRWNCLIYSRSNISGRVVFYLVQRPREFLSEKEFLSERLVDANLVTLS